VIPAEGEPVEEVSKEREEELAQMTYKYNEEVTAAKEKWHK
jgi:hypothetical protein